MPDQNRTIILASQSPQRKAIFDTLNISYQQIPADINEAAIDAENEQERARKIAQVKAAAVVEKFPKSIVIAADTYSVMDGKAFEKPSSKKEAQQMLKELSGNKCQTYTGFCYLDKKNEIEESETVITDFVFRPLSESEITHYVENNPVTTWSAAFSPAYDSGLALLESMDGPVTSFTHGLPLEKVVYYLRKSGVEV